MRTSDTGERLDTAEKDRFEFALIMKLRARARLSRDSRGHTLPCDHESLRVHAYKLREYTPLRLLFRYLCSRTPSSIGANNTFCTGDNVSSEVSQHSKVLWETILGA